MTETNPADPNIRVRPSSRPFWFGVFLSVSFLVGVTAYARHRDWQLDQLSIEEFATLLSGVFAPLAFLWLVLGYRQQGDELRHSADALWLQGEELRNSVEQQKELVRAARDQIELDQQALEAEQLERESRTKPILRISPSGTTSLSGNTLQHDFSLINIGGVLRDMFMTIDGDPHPHGFPAFGQSNFVLLPVLFETEIDRTAKIVIVGRDTADNKRVWEYNAIHRNGTVLIRTVKDGERVQPRTTNQAAAEGT